MNQYFYAKVKEFETTLKWLFSQIALLRISHPHQSSILDFMQNKTSEAERHYHKLVNALSINFPRIENRALSMIRDIELSLYLVNSFYLSAVRNVNEETLKFRSIILEILKSQSFDWISEILVTFNGPYSTLPSDSIPIITIPPIQTVSFYGFSAIYHEIGHNLYYKQMDIERNLNAIIEEHFNDLRINPGPLTVLKREEREKNIENAFEYWQPTRLNELFSDIYATYSTGVAFLFTITDMMIRYGTNPYDVDFSDEHPPNALRLYASTKTLPGLLASSSIAATLEEISNGYLQKYTPEAKYNIFCSKALLDKLVAQSINEIGTWFPKAQRYERVIPSFSDMEDPQKASCLEEILNWGVSVLLNNHEEFIAWQEKALQFVYET